VKELLIAKFVKLLTELGLKIVGNNLHIKHEVFWGASFKDDVWYFFQLLLALASCHLQIVEH